MAAAELGAHVTGVDLAPELIDVGAKKASAAGYAVTWATADAGDTGLPGEFADAVVSNLGIIFVAPDRQLAEIQRLLKPDGVLSFSSWVRASANPLFDPVIAVLGAPPARNFSPDQWGDTQVINARLSPHFDAIEIETGTHTWTFASMADALRFVSSESPLHVDIFDRTNEAQRDRLLTAFEAALLPHLAEDGIAFDVPYVVITALRR